MLSTIYRYGLFMLIGLIILLLVNILTVRVDFLKTAAETATTGFANILRENIVIHQRTPGRRHPRSSQIANICYHSCLQNRYAWTGDIRAIGRNIIECPCTRTKNWLGYEEFFFPPVNR